jgi:hypothetical protein
VKELDVKEILNNNPFGKDILEDFDENVENNQQAKRKISRILTNYVMENFQRPSVEMILKLAGKIVSVFKTDKKVRTKP